MSFQAVTAAIPVMKRLGLDPSERLLLLVMAVYARPDRELFPSQETLAFDTGLSVRTVRRSLNSLAERGLIARRPRYRGGSRTTDIISLVFIPAMDAAITGVIPAIGVVHTGQTTHLKPATMAGESKEENQEGTSRAPTRGAPPLVLDDQAALKPETPGETKGAMAARLRSLADEINPTRRIG